MLIERRHLIDSGRPYTIVSAVVLLRYHVSLGQFLSELLELALHAIVLFLQAVVARPKMGRLFLR